MDIRFVYRLWLATTPLNTSFKQKKFWLPEAKSLDTTYKKETRRLVERAKIKVVTIAELFLLSVALDVASEMALTAICFCNTSAALLEAAAAATEAEETDATDATDAEETDATEAEDAEATDAD